jgi:acyl-[acyl-carrier-protein]-phospholipid O-acyltransferase / long-chain-fatty-acid--[acyl-carrier-protein] ligase
VTTVPDIKRGERIAVLDTDLGQTPEQVCQKLGAGSLAKLWIPSPRDFVKVEEIPCLAVGKRDLRKVREMAAEGLGV